MAEGATGCGNAYSLAEPDLLRPAITLLMPYPRGANDVVKTGVTRLPSQLAHGLRRARYQHRRIARPPRMNLHRNGVSCNAARRLHNVSHTETPTITKVVDQ